MATRRGKAVEHLGRSDSCSVLGGFSGKGTVVASEFYQLSTRIRAAAGFDQISQAGNGKAESVEAGTHI